MAELTTLARPYARAAFEAAVEAGQLQQWSEMLSVVAAVMHDRRVVTVLSKPSLTAQEQARILNDLCGDDINEYVRNFIRILADNKRLALIDEIVELFEKLKASREKTIDVDVVTAFPMSDEAQQRLVDSLKSRLQRDVKVHSDVDRSLIGGLVVRAGDLVIDGSVRGKLNKLAEAMNS